MTAGDPAAPRRHLLSARCLALSLEVAWAVALIPAYAVIAPTSRWGDPVLLIALAVLAVVAFRSVVRLPSGVGFDAMDALMVLAVALAGPLPALGIIVLPWIDLVFVRRGGTSDAPWFFTLPGYLAGYGWQAIAAAVLLQATGVTDPTAPAAVMSLLAAGAIMNAVGWALGPAVYIPLWVGQPARAAVRAYLDMLPVAGLMIALGAATVMLSGPLGVLALAVFALIAILPQSFLTYAARTRPVARLDPDTATARYGHAIAVHLGLSYAERRHLAAVAQAARARPPTGEIIGYIEATALDARLAVCDAQLVTEWWNGGGGPFGLRSGQIPWAARVLAVARTWSALTARGGPELSHREAMDHLREAAGVCLDPTVVRAARAVVGQELVSTHEPAPEPRLHNLHIPAPLRRALSASAAPGDLLGG